MSPNARRQLILGGLIAGLAAWLVVPQLLQRGGPTPARAATVDDDGLAESDRELLKPLLSAVAAMPARELQAAAAWPESPFQRTPPAAPEPARLTAAAPAPARPGLRLDGIIAGSVPRALVSGRIVGVGDRLPGGYRVAAIDSDSVTLEGSEGPWTLSLAE